MIKLNPENYFAQFKKFGEKDGFKPGLDRVQYILSELGNPQEDLNIVHIGGTNGKGSTIAMLKSIFLSAGYNVGTYISPPLYNFRERITYGNRNISKKELNSVINYISPVVKKVNPSFFEVVTVAAFVFLKMIKADPVLLEVGLGGRLDATNVVEKPLVSVITGIDLEHTEILGDTLEDIAREKAGIIKNKTPVITGVFRGKTRKVIAEKAKKLETEMIEVYEKYNFDIHKNRSEYIEIMVERDSFKELIKCSLSGSHQVRNILLALEVLNNLKEKFPVDVNVVKKGFKTVFWPGRFEIISKKPLFIVDGAHNEAGMKVLKRYICEHIPKEKRVKIIFAVLKDKDINKMFAVLKKLKKSYEIELIITASDNKRSASPKSIKKIADRCKLNYKVEKSLKKAVNNTLKKSNGEEVIFATGSLSIVKEVTETASDI